MLNVWALVVLLANYKVSFVSENKVSLHHFEHITLFCGPYVATSTPHFGESNNSVGHHVCSPALGTPTRKLCSHIFGAFIRPV